MKKQILLASTVIFATTGFSAAQAQLAQDLIYVAVDPCRIADTRKSAVGAIRANTSRNLLVAGSDSQLAVQGGTVNCLNPKGDVRPVAISAYILAVPADSSTSQGVLTAYPSNESIPPPGTGSTVNFSEGQIIGNTTNAKICANGSACPSDGELAILARITDEHVVVDVQGYYYPADSISRCFSADLEGSWQTFIAAPSLGWSSCEVEFDISGGVVSGECISSGGGSSVTGGQLQISSTCEVTGNIVVGGVSNDVETSRLSADRNSIAGIVTIQGDSTTFNAVRF